MTENLGFEYEVLKHYLNKGMWARAGLIDLLIKDLREHAKREQVIQELGLDEKEVTAALQTAVISHLMMFAEDLAVFSRAISEGNLNYYEYLDKSGDEELGKVIGAFYNEITGLPDDKLAKILSFADISTCEFILDNEREIISRIEGRIVQRTKIFFNKMAMFGDNHHGISKRYKHAGFPILLAQALPAGIYDSDKFEFVTLGLISKGEVGAEILPIPYSEKAVESYVNLKKDIFSFLGNILTFKVICIERNVDGLFPHNDNLFGINLNADEKMVLDNVWKRFETKCPLPKGKTRDGMYTRSKILLWYEDLENTGKRVLL